MLDPFEVLIEISPLAALVCAFIFYMRHRERVEPQDRVPAIAYVLAVIGCGASYWHIGISLGIRLACSFPNPGTLCGLFGYFVTGPLLGASAVFLIGLLVFFIRPVRSRPENIEQGKKLT